MKKILLLTGFLIVASININAQSLKQDTLFLPDQLRQYQFQLAEPAQSIENLRYDQSGEPVKGNLSPDGKRVIMDNYKKGQRVRVTLIYADGRSEEMTKSPCYIDPVSYEL